MEDNEFRLGVLVSHPIQYFIPVYRELESIPEVCSTVFFLTDRGIQESFDEGFGRTIRYDVDLKSGYRSRFLKHWKITSTLLLNSVINYELFRPKFYQDLDALVINGWGQVSLIIGILGCRITKTPYLLFCDSTIHSIENRNHGRFGNFVKKKVIGLIITNAFKCLWIGSLNREFYLKYGAKQEQLHHVPLTIDNEAFMNGGRDGRVHREASLKQLGLDPALRTILFTGKLQAWKRPLDIIDAVSRVKADVNLIIIGDGPLMKAVEESIKPLKNARALGFINQTLIQRWYGIADLFVMPSELEPWGLAVNEAMAAGCVPIVANSVGCAPDLVSQDTGLQFSVGDTNELSECLNLVLADDYKLEHFRRHCREKIAEYSPRNAAIQIWQAVKSKVID